MRMFVIHTRALPGVSKDTGDPLSIVEVEVEKVVPLQDPSVIWLLPGEFKARILKPTFLYETHEKTTVPPIYYSHSIYQTKEEALRAAHQLIVQGLEFAVRKGRLTSYTEEEVVAKCAEIRELLLPD